MGVSIAYFVDDKVIFIIYSEFMAMDSQKRDIALWLFIVAGAVAMMVVVGGLTRLTDSGLSITQWQPIAGIVPPLSQAAWAEAFLLYQQIPEYQLINRGMSLAEFKYIYWWEWAHRALGRVVGVIFLVPFLVFLWRRRLSWGETPALLVLFVLGAGQGVLGWYMVQSGLVDRVDVSHYRLAAHLGLALVIFVFSLWLGLRYWYGKGGGTYQGLATLIVVLVLGQSVLGALVAGLDAGKVYNDFPLMAGAWIPEGLFSPLSGAVLDDPLSVQFIHRITAYALFLLVIWHSWTIRNSLDLTAKALLTAIFAQILLGIATLIYIAPLALAAAHQIGGVVVLALATTHLYKRKNKC